MKNTKKTLAKVFACAMAFGLTFAAVGCGKAESEAKKEENFIAAIGGTSETYTGAVSTESYETANAAASAYVATEVVGQKNVEVVNTETKANYEGEQIASLGLPTEVSDGALAVEEVEVEYSVSDSEAYMAAASSSTKKVKV